MDRAIGIVLGIVLGIAVMAAFVFLGSEDTIDAPRISGAETERPAQQEKRAPQAPSPQKPFRFAP